VSELTKPKIKKGSRLTRDPFVEYLFCNYKILPADPDMRTEVIKPIIKTVVACTFHFTFNWSANIDFLFQIKS